MDALIRATVGLRPFPLLPHNGAPASLTALHRFRHIEFTNPQLSVRLLATYSARHHATHYGSEIPHYART
ncbi:hypothetical protein K523DRAFT_324904 [Schizophyllum commune Tattone D]|nr:hypothetical protein K523DRAFT_324904 [Schizophyllum commune Tattone D]